MRRFIKMAYQRGIILYVKFVKILISILFYIKANFNKIMLFSSNHLRLLRTLELHFE